jgi:hypothetical protein
MYLSEDIIKALKKLWDSIIFKEIYKRGNEFALGDNCF